jgi:anti-sigma-K factor RskA
MQADAYISSGVLELYVAGVLPAEQVQEVEAMAARHPMVKAEIEKLEKVYREYSSAQARFPDHLFDSILERIERQPEAPPVVEPQPVVKKLPDKKVKTVREPEKRVEKREEAPTIAIDGSGAPGYMRPMLAAAVVLFTLSALLNLYFYDRWQRSDLAVAQLRQEKLTWEQQVEQADATHKASMDMLAMYEDTNYSHIMMKGQRIAPKAMAMVFWNKKDKKVYLAPKNLPPLPEGKQYQLWAVNMEGKPVDAGVLAPEQTNPDALVPMKKIPEAQAFAISLEPMGGSATPTNNAVYVVGGI